MPSFVALIILIFGKLGSPKGEVVSDELHDGRGVFILVFGKVLDVGNGVIEGLFGHFAGFAGLVHDFIVEHGEVQSETKPDGVGGF